MTVLPVLSICALLTLAPLCAADWADEFNAFEPSNWTAQPGGLRLAEEPPPAEVALRDGILALEDPLRGVRLTSRSKFLWGTLEARVRLRSAGYQYIGFMSREPWGANTLMCMSLQDGTGWRLMASRDGKGGETGISAPIPLGEWCELRITWQPGRAALYVNGQLKGELTAEAQVPATPLPIILDAYPNNPLDVDWLRVSGETQARSDMLMSAPPPAAGPTVVLQSADWEVRIDSDSGTIRECHQLLPTPLRWTPEGVAGLDLYVRRLPDGQPVRFRRIANAEATAAADQRFTCRMAQADGPLATALQAELSIQLAGALLQVSARLTSLQDIAEPVEIGLGLPFRPEPWRRHIFPRLPWLVLAPLQDRQVRFPFLADPSDPTVSSQTGNWIFLPIGILEAADRMVLWGGMDVGHRTVLAPNNAGCAPAVTLGMKAWSAGETRELGFTMRAFPKPHYDLPQVLRWYLSHCISSDPLTSDLFPIRDWTPRVLPQGGGVSIYDARVGRADPNNKVETSDRIEGLLMEHRVPNLWLGGWHGLEGSYPTTGQWWSVYGRRLSAEGWRAEVLRLKALGLRPCLYAFQFIVPELCQAGGRPDKGWVAYGADGTLSMFDHFVAGEGKMLGDWFTKEVAQQIGTDTITWAYADFGNDDFRRWYTEQIKAAVETYQPSGIAFDFGWAVVGPNSVYSPANPRTSQAHGRLRVQADIWHWLRQHHPDMQIIVNDCPGSPSQAFANCMLCENSDTMCDVDFLAGKALGSTMASMDYFADHDRVRWTRHVMLNLARGCSLGLPFWILTNPPEADYVPTWREFLDFSSRTTRLPLLPTKDAVRSLAADCPIVGSVWSDGQECIACAFDPRANGPERPLALCFQIPASVPPQASWSLTRLSALNVGLRPSGWSVERPLPEMLQAMGPLAPGEMVLLEATVPVAGG